MKYHDKLNNRDLKGGELVKEAPIVKRLMYTSKLCHDLRSLIQVTYLFISF